MLEIRHLDETDLDWLKCNSKRLFNGEIIVSRGIIHQVFESPGFIAVLNGERVGVSIYHVSDNRCELVSIEALRQWQGIGSALIKTLVDFALEQNIKELWLITTNDNVDALRFYQKRGFKLRAVYPGALNESRKLKPEIAKIGNYGIPMTDEIELYIDLAKAWIPPNSQISGSVSEFS